MTILVKNKYTLEINGFKFRCSIGKNGTTLKKKKKETTRHLRENFLWEIYIIDPIVF